MAWSDVGYQRTTPQSRRRLLIVATLLVLTVATSLTGTAGAVETAGQRSPRLRPHTEWVPASAPVGLADVSCPSPWWCLGVGRASARGTAAVWNGREWVPLALPEDPVNPFFVELRAVDCWSRSFCVAVGSFSAQPSTISEPYVLHWDGWAWTRAVVPVPGGMNRRLVDVSCPSRRSCVAVGTSSTQIFSAAYAMAWNGTTWSLNGMPSTGNPGGERPVITGVSCVRGPTCLAVGNLTSSLRSLRPFVFRLTGTSWSPIDAPDVGTNAGELNGIVCHSADACTAVGALRVGGVLGVDQAAISEWNGTEWTDVPVPSSGAAARLNDIDCGFLMCVAVGAQEVGGVQRPLVVSEERDQWVENGTARLPAAPLGEVSCVAPLLCIATEATGFGLGSSTRLAVPRLFLW
jgi:hypothetical protein